jgi:hypothetical protein
MNCGMSVLTAIGSAYFVMSAAHTREDTKTTNNMFEASPDAMRAERTMPGTLSGK